ncbi:40S RIBOSOMAL PROTEIN S18 [Encephalitozoon cuniculi GB-M1]|uniref:Small ribosomal subunit protein uS13 n=2 Tax=Encephalitozoon cuniculi TaxID=6035 RepID=RS18_ENCCU|nr:40S ribosomal protein S18 [Encephalitozoon cuniculi GB-M1]Q8SRP2.1 RecName: Full=Small ribosomal subunit protein uS13; AltName: Full=40S ribosomal protein S18 [Encephalitozoon cuniculi GB-M1]7QEP_C8 Chain C8, 40S ribosomal protein S18 [Encephalitozoon cuniculi GB-M1]AGE95759.1 40S ribosomal protein S18 [Encephalitozoon cuniculi]KMV66005.1 40S ribosomal protein S18 [Encephalitozoon cuniculi EcunIII-L]CAD25471.1 40S RIBOSOMAL PROTEIN S18 [Encephalitozoon cuniculi GB-M1]
MNYTYDPAEVQYIVRIHNTNIDGTKRIPFALTKIRGIGIRIATAICKRLGIDLRKRAGEMGEDEMKRISDAILDPASVGIPESYMNHQRDIIDGTTSHLIGTRLDADLRMMIERGKKNKRIRAYRLDVGLKVRGQRTKSNGRRGRSMGVSRKK